MDLNLTVSSFLNAGGALLFLVEGLAILAIARGARPATLIGGLAATFGLSLVVENLLDYAGGGNVEGVIVIGALVAASVFGFLVAVDVARRSSPGDRAALYGLWWATAGVTAFAIGLGVFAEEVRVRAGFGDGVLGAVNWVVQGTFFAWLGFLLTAGVFAFRACPPAGATQRRAIGLMLLSFGLFTMFLAFANALAPLGYTGWKWSIWAGILAGALVNLAACAALLVPNGGHEPRLARMMFLALLAAGLAACVVTFAGGNSFAGAFGFFGIMRTVGAFFLALAVVKYNLLSIPLPRVAARRGVLATAALAALFIVAQVAQNFFAAEYGLLMGGVVAGAVVFAASPLQRAMEAKAERRSTSPAAETGPVARRERTYRNALRLAMRDRKLTAQEEAHLFELAEDLGIGAGRAFQLKREVEAEAP